MAKWNGMKWENFVIDSNNVGSDCSLSFDAVNDWHISYRDAGNLNLKYANSKPISRKVKKQEESKPEKESK